MLIVDWDLHHGDGTQSIFAGDESVYQISIHSALDLYMALACGSQYGTSIVGQQLGHCNLPVMSSAYTDEMIEGLHFSGVFYRSDEILPAFYQALENIPWKPDLILIFSGYDGHMNDQGAGIMDWADESFRLLTRGGVILPVQDLSGFHLLAHALQDTLFERAGVGQEIDLRRKGPAQTPGSRRADTTAHDRNRRTPGHSTWLIRAGYAPGADHHACVPGRRTHRPEWSG